MRRVWKWTKRIVLGTLLFVIVTLLVVIGLLHTDWGRGKALSMVVPMLQKKFPGGISVERLEGSVLGDIELVGIKVNGIDGKLMYSVGRAKANLDFGALFTKTIEVEFIEAWDVVAIDPGNPTAPPTDDAPLPFWVELPSIKVHKLSATINGEQPMTFENGEVEAALSISKTVTIDATLTKLDAYWKERAMPVHVEAEAKVGEQVRIPRLVATLADTRVEGKDILVDMAQPVAVLTIHATPQVVASFAPQVALPAPADIKLAISAAGKETKIDLEATMGPSTLHGAFLGMIETQQARGMLSASGVDLHTFVPRITGSGDAVIAFTVDGNAATGHVLALLRGQLLDLPAGHAMIDLSATTKQARALLIAGGTGDVGTAGVGTILRDGKKLDLADASIVATARNASAATGGQAPFKGFIRAIGRAHGSIMPKLAIELDGSVKATNLVATDPKIGLSIGSLDGRADATLSEEGTYSHLHATVTNVRRAGSPLGTFEVDARNRRDGKIAAHLTAKPAALPGSTAEIDAVVSLGKQESDPLVVELGDHSLKANRIAWAGTGGSITVTDAGVEVRGIESRSGNASLKAEATVNKLSGALAVKVDAKNVAASMIDPTFKGTVSAKADLQRRGLRWDGKANVTLAGLQLGPDKPAIEGGVALTVAGSHVKADINANAFQVGGVRLVLDVDGPRDITDPLAWRKLDRKAIRTALLGVTRIDLAAAKVSTGGTIDGELVLAGTEPSGTFTIKGVQTPLGMVEGDINFASMGDEIGMSSTVRVQDVGEAQIAAQIAIPMHPFEPAEWQRLGRGIARSLTVTAENIEVTPAKLAKLGIDAPYSANVSLGIALAAGAGEVRAKVDVKNVRGGRLLKPVDVHVEAAIDPKDTSATVTVDGNKQQVVIVNAKLPGFGFDRWIADAKSVTAAPLTGSVELPNVDVVNLLSMFGRIDITSGKIGGVVTIAGTPLAPTAEANLVISNVNVKPRLAGRKLPTLTELKIAGKWDGAMGSAIITGKESDGATLDISASARPDNLAALQAKIDIRKFDIAPIAVFLPGPLVAATGKIGAKITVTGLDPDKIRGTLALEKARVPVHPQVGTIRDANVAIKLTDLGLAYNIEAKIGAGNVKLKGQAPKDLSRISITGAVEKFSPIGEIQPVIGASLDGTLYREENLLRGDIKISNASVFLDMEAGVKLLESEMPEDLFLGRSTPPPPVPKQQRIPRKPWITLLVKLDSTPIDVKHEYFVVRARASSPRGVAISIGRQLGMDGSIEIERGDVDVLGRQYRVDPGPDKVRFDGSTDPLLNIRLVHEFPELTLTADLVGRASKREIRMSGTPALYSQDQLFAFFLGGDPSGEAGATTRDAATSVGSALVSAKLARQAKKVLPFRIDTLSCDAGTSATGSGCKAGRWITSNWFLQFKQRIEPRPDENPQEIQLQYYFKKNWILEGAGFLERFGGDVLWRKRW